MNFSFEQAGPPFSLLFHAARANQNQEVYTPCRKQSPYAPTAEKTGHQATVTAAIVVLRSSVPDLFRSCTTRSTVHRLSFADTHAKRADMHGPQKECWTMSATVPGAAVLLRLWKIHLHHRMMTRTTHSPSRFFRIISGKRRKLSRVWDENI